MRPLNRLLAGLALCLPLALPGLLPAARAAAATPPTPPTGIQAVVTLEGVTEYRLNNGLTLLLAPDAARPQTTVNMSYRVGSRHEGPGQTGMAHLLEHLLFRGSPQFPDAMAEFSRRGLAANGSTTTDLTNYYATFASDPDTLRWYLSWQADAMQHASISRADLDAEMPVVRNEMEQGENSPFSILMQLTNAAAYTWHPYGRSVIGARSDVENVDIDQLRAFYHQYYQPDNAVLIITGDFDPEQTLRWVAEAFDPIARPTRPRPAEYTTEPVQQGARAITLERIGGSPMAIVQYHFPAGASDAFTALSMGTAMLTDSPAGPLYQDLVQPGLASGAFGFTRALQQPGYVVFGAQLQPGADPATVLETLEKTLESNGIQRLDEAALARNRTAWLNQWKKVYEHSASLAGALSDAVSRGDWRLFFIEPLRVRALTLDGIRAALSQWLVPNNRTSGLYLPTPDPVYAPAAPAADLAPWIAQLKTGTGRPGVAAFDTSPLALDAATQRDTLILPNGEVRLALLPKPTPGEQVFVSFSLRFGAAQDMQGLGLVPDITAALLLRGAQGLNRQQIEDRLTELDSSLSFSSSGNTLSVGMRTSKAQLPALFDLAFTLLRHPSFPQEELEEIQRSLETNIENQAVSPAWLVQNTLQRHGQPWPPKDVRYTPTAPELSAEAQALTRDKIQAFHQKFYGAGNLLVSAVGDFDPQALKDSLRKGLDGWRQAPGYQRIDDPWYAVSPETFHIAAPGKANANYLAALPLQLQDTDPRWPALILANYLLGGSQDSRLWQAIRVQGGLSYTVGSRIQASAWEASGSWTLFATMASQNADALQQAMQQALSDTLKTGFTQAEVDQAVGSLLNYMKLGRSSDGSLASHWLDYLETGRSFAWQQDIIARLQALSAAEVNDALRAFLKPGQFSIAVAADNAG
ncbi:M16 family metallopeptidase [Castellaniella hirudinis]|uniref:M16 family metallopeptidase n=1 Tax=Castellaniella hirudinis TaxID=1144617 RepID=UPI0039C07728